ncbi:MAG: hypothetical protein ABJB98_02945 [Actinomycetota bacterium]
MRTSVAAAVLVAAATVGAVTTVESLLDGRSQVHRARQIRRVDGRPALLRDNGDRFIGFVAAHVPPSAKIRIVQPIRPRDHDDPVPLGPAGVCGNQVYSGEYWWVVYALLPRKSVCAADGSWTVYLHVPVPNGVTYRFSPTLGVAAP